MAKDDYHVIVYRILSYLYQCLKEGKEENILGIFFDELLDIDVPESYWKYIFVHLVNFGYIEGIECRYEDNNLRLYGGKVYITPVGIEYLLNDKMMNKASYHSTL